MTSRDDPYTRVYHRLSDEYPHVFDDAKALGTWLRLLVLADAAFPMTPVLPANVDRKSLAILTGSELVTVTGTRYDIKGLRPERERRANASRIGAESRWRGNANAVRSDSGPDADAMRTHSNGTANGMPRQDETRKRLVTDKRDGIGTVRASRGPVDPS